MRIVFFGTPAFAVPSLRALASSPHEVVAVVTQPDRPRGRGQRVSGSPVKDVADALAIPVRQPDRMKDAGFVGDLRGFAADLGVVAAYGKILTDEVLAVPRLGMINVHASLLPRWRGAAPIHRAILAGDQTTGVTIMRVVKALDAGPMLAAFETPIAPNETSADLEARLARVGANLLLETVDNLARGAVTEIEQDPSLVTYASRLTREDGRLDLTRSAQEVHNAIRGLQPWPMASVMLGGKRVLLLQAELAAGTRHEQPPGTVVRLDSDAIVVATGDGAVRLRRLQIEGRPAVEAADFVNGHHVRVGHSFTRLPPAS